MLHYAVSRPRAAVTRGFQAPRGGLAQQPPGLPSGDVVATMSNESRLDGHARSFITASIPNSSNQGSRTPEQLLMFTSRCPLKVQIFQGPGPFVYKLLKPGRSLNDCSTRESHIAPLCGTRVALRSCGAQPSSSQLLTHLYVH